MAIIKIKNQAIDLDAAEIPNLPASKITSGTFADARIADLAATKLTGTIATARLGSGTASNTTFLRGDQSYQTLSEFNDDKLVNDISTLALHQATNNNSAKYNLTNSNVDVYQDSSAIANLTNVQRDTTGEYISTTGYSGGRGATTFFHVDGNDATNPFRDLINNVDASVNDISNTGGTPVRNTSNDKWAGYDVLDINNGTLKYDLSSSWNGAGNYTVDYWLKHIQVDGRDRLWTWDKTGYSIKMTLGIDYGTSADFNAFAKTASSSYEYPVSGTFNLEASNTTWNHFRYVRSGTTHYYYFNGSLIGSRAQGDYGADDQNLTTNDFRISGRRSNNTTGSEFIDAYYTDFMMHSSALTTASSFTVPTAKAGFFSSATGNYESTTQTANASVNKISGVVTYTNASGTATLNTDIILQVSADNGSNWTNATLTPAGTFSSGVLQAVTNDISVTAGTQLKYKIFFANQASGSKVARINGVSLSY